MKVLLASFDSLATLRGGVELYTHHLAQALARRGHEVRVLARRPERGAESVLDGVAYEWAPLPAGAPSHRYRLLHEPRFWRAAKRAAAWADVVHSQNIDALGALDVRPVVATVHTTPLDEWESSRLGGWRELLYQRQVEAYRRAMWRRFARRAAHLWTPGEHVRGSLEELGAREVEVLANPVARTPHVPQAEARRRLDLPAGRLVLYLGRLAPVKRVERLLAALPPDAHLVVAGEGPEEARLRAEAAKLGARVRFLGRVDEMTKALLLHAADVLALPSEHEGQPLSLLEAIAAGTPVAATRAAWVPPELRGYGAWGEDIGAALDEALARGRHEDAPVMDYDAYAARVSEVYEEVARR